MGRPPTPWTDPKVGDACSTRGGRKRSVLQVTQTVWFRHSYPDRVTFDAGGSVKTISAASWATWCRNQMASGGAYERNGRKYRVEDGLFDGTDHL